jgi:hypothetical protein
VISGPQHAIYNQERWPTADHSAELTYAETLNGKVLFDAATAGHLQAMTP